MASDINSILLSLQIPSLIFPRYQTLTNIPSDLPPPPVNSTVTHQEAPKRQPSMVHPVSIPVRHVREMNMLHQQGKDTPRLLCLHVIIKLFSSMGALHQWPHHNEGFQII